MTKPYKRFVTRKGKLFCPCRHCGKNGWDAYMLTRDLWKMVLPPEVGPESYSAGIYLLALRHRKHRPATLQRGHNRLQWRTSLARRRQGDRFEFEICFHKRQKRSRRPTPSF